MIILVDKAPYIKKKTQAPEAICEALNGILNDRFFLTAKRRGSARGAAFRYVSNQKNELRK